MSHAEGSIEPLLQSPAGEHSKQCPVVIIIVSRAYKSMSSRTPYVIPSNERMMVASTVLLLHVYGQYGICRC